MADTAATVNQGGASGSTRHPERRQAIAHGGGGSAPRAGRDGRRPALAVPTDRLVVTNGMVSASDDKSKRVSYARTDRRQIFQRPARLEQARSAIRSMRPARRSRRSPSEYKVVGQSIQREDVAPKVFAQENFVTDIKLPGMLHGRVIRPAVAGAVPTKVDENSIKDIPGARVVRDKGFLRVVADKEWDAIRPRRSSRWSGRRRSAVPRNKPRSTTTSARRPCASAASTRKTAMSTRSSRAPPR